MISQHYKKNISSHRKLLRTELSGGKLNVHSQKKEASPQIFKNQRDDISDLIKLREKYAFRGQIPQNEHRERRLYKCYSDGTLLQDNRFCTIPKISQGQSQNRKNENYISKMFKYRHCKQEEARKTDKNQVNFESKMKEAVEKLKSKSAGTFNKEKSLSILRKRYRNESSNNQIVSNQFIQNLDYSNRSSYRNSAQVHKPTKKVKKNIRIPHNQKVLQDYDDYSLRKMTKLPLRQSKIKSENASSHQEISDLEAQSSLRIPYLARQQMRNLLEKQEPENNLPQSDYEKIKMLEKQSNIPHTFFRNFFSEMTDLSESSLSMKRGKQEEQDSGALSRLIENHQKGLLSNNSDKKQEEFDQYSLKDSKLSKTKKTKKKPQVFDGSRIIFTHSNATNSMNFQQKPLSRGSNPERTLEETGKFIVQANSNLLSLQSRQKGISANSSKNCPLIETNSQEKAGYLTSKTTGIKIPELQQSYFTTPRETINQVPHLPQESIHPDQHRKKKFNLVESIQLWYSQEEKNLSGMNFRMTEDNSEQMEISDKNKIADENIIDRIYSHLSKLNFIAEFVKMKEEMYEGEISQIYDVPSFLIYKRFYQERVRMQLSMKGDDHSCFVLTNSQINDHELRKMRTNHQFRSILSSLQECNRLIEHSVTEYFEKIQEQSLQKYELASIALDTIKPKEVGFIMMLLNEEMENLVIKRAQIFKNLSNQVLPSSESKFGRQTSINQRMLEHEICQSDQYEALSLRVFSIVEIVFLLSELSGRRVKECELDFQFDEFEHYFTDYYGLFKQTILFFN